jgi:CheY-like chemotaxis protein
LNCYAVSTGEEGVALSEYFDLILMDIQLPGISGLEASTRIRLNEAESQLQAVPIVAITSFPNRAECLLAGMNDHFEKPISKTEIAQILEHWVFGQPHKLRELG